MGRNDARQQRGVLRGIARRAMLARGLMPDFSDEAMAELAKVREAVDARDAADSDAAGGAIADLRKLLWCSIDNDDSRDLDQLTVAEALAGGAVKIFVAVADVDSLVKKDSAIDEHARQNTTSVYTAGQIFPMLPEKLSTDLTSLNFEEDRLALVVEMEFAEDTSLRRSKVYRAMVRNQAKLAYNAVAAWLTGKGAMPAAIGAVPGLEENLRLQDRIAQELKAKRRASGALDFETIQPKPVFDGDELKDLVADQPNQAKDLIADFMIAANGVVARYLGSMNFPSLRRVVRKPKRWDRIVELAAGRGVHLPKQPESKALEEFLSQEREADAVRFPDLSLSIIKLLGNGEYVAQMPGENAVGHFGLAVKDYAHSTAPNRRFPDLITQRLVKSALARGLWPYDRGEMERLAKHCTESEDAAQKVERQVAKSAAAMLLEGRIGQQFDGIVSGMNDAGMWVRIFHPPVEGKLDSKFMGVDVGKRIRVQLVRTDVEQGFIDFRQVG